MKTIEKKIIAFHIGRGGRFNNQGYLTFIGEKNIGDFTEDLFCNFENENDFKKRVGFESSHENVKCILDCITYEDFDTLEENYGITKEMLGEKVYYSSNGRPVGLTEKDVEIGIGSIDEDGQYDTTYTTYLYDLSEGEIEAIKRYNGYKSQDIRDAIGGEDEETETEE